MTTIRPAATARPHNEPANRGSIAGLPELGPGWPDCGSVPTAATENDCWQPPAGGCHSVPFRPNQSKDLAPPSARQDSKIADTPPLDAAAARSTPDNAAEHRRLPSSPGSDTAPPILGTARCRPSSGLLRCSPIQTLPPSPPALRPVLLASFSESASRSPAADGAVAAASAESRSPPASPDRLGTPGLSASHCAAANRATRTPSSPTRCD